MENFVILFNTPLPLPHIQQYYKRIGFKPWQGKACQPAFVLLLFPQHLHNARVIQAFNQHTRPRRLGDTISGII